MKNRYAALLLVVSLAAGAYAADPPKTREIQADPVQRAAMEKLSRQGAEIDEEWRRVQARIKAHQAESAAIMSSIRASLGLASSEQFSAYDQARGVFTVTEASETTGEGGVSGHGAPSTPGK